jgi:hypothetical protein
MIVCGTRLCVQGPQGYGMGGYNGAAAAPYGAPPPPAVSGSPDRLQGSCTCAPHLSLLTNPYTSHAKHPHMKFIGYGMFLIAFSLPCSSSSHRSSLAQPGVLHRRLRPMVARLPATPGDLRLGRSSPRSRPRHPRRSSECLGICVRLRS